MLPAEPSATIPTFFCALGEGFPIGMGALPRLMSMVKGEGRIRLQLWKERTHRREVDMVTLSREAEGPEPSKGECPLPASHGGSVSAPPPFPC